MATFVTFFAAIAALFLLVLVWVGIDRLAHKRLGVRNTCCHSFDPDSASGGCCGKHETCDLRDQSSGHTTYSLRQ